MGLGTVFLSKLHFFAVSEEDGDGFADDGAMFGVRVATAAGDMDGIGAATVGAVVCCASSDPVAEGNGVPVSLPRLFPYVGVGEDAFCDEEGTGGLGEPPPTLDGPGLGVDFVAPPTGSEIGSAPGAICDTHNGAGDP